MNELPSNHDITPGGKVSQTWLHWFNLVHLTIQATRQSGTTAQRPDKGLWIGRRFFDTTLGQPVYVKSVGPVVWVDATGATV